MAKIYKDKYYTPETVVKAVINFINNKIKKIDDFDRIIEPSSGAGAFIKNLPDKVIGYDIEPHFNNGNVITGDYLKQNINYMPNSLVIGNPPFDDGSGSNNLHIKFIEYSVQHSDYVAFILPIDMYNKDTLKNAELLYSIKIKDVNYSGVKLKTCLNIYTKRKSPLCVKKIKGVSILKFSRSKKTTLQDEINWKKKSCDYRLASFGTIRLLKSQDNVKCAEFKITFDKKINFAPKLEIFIKEKRKNSISKSGCSKQDLINLIYDNCPELRDDK